MSVYKCTYVHVCVWAKNAPNVNKFSEAKEKVAGPLSDVCVRGLAANRLCASACVAMRIVGATFAVINFFAAYAKHLWEINLKNSFIHFNVAFLAITSC